MSYHESGSLYKSFKYAIFSFFLIFTFLFCALPAKAEYAYTPMPFSPPEGMTDCYLEEIGSNGRALLACYDGSVFRLYLYQGGTYTPIVPEGYTSSNISFWMNGGFMSETGDMLIYACNSDGSSCSQFFAYEELPSHFDWRDYVDLPPIRAQGHCGSCWAFSAVGAVECTYAAKYGTIIDLSEQNLVSADCGCSGSCYSGYAVIALNHIKITGIVDESCFPYQSGFCRNPLYPLFGSRCLPWCSCGEDCSNPCSCDLCDDSQDRLTKIQAWHKVPNNIEDVKRALISYGPLSVSSSNWRHSVVLVGYDDYKGHWIIRNSHGVDEDDDGYYYIPYSGHLYSDIINQAFYIVLY